jgi:hypothetical protein
MAGEIMRHAQRCRTRAPALAVGRMLQRVVLLEESF